MKKLTTACLVSLLTLSLTSACHSLFGIDDESEEPGYLYYTTDSSGTVEVWAIPDIGGAAIRLSEGASETGGSLPSAPVASPDGARVAISLARAQDGSFDGNRHLWVMDADGANLTYLTQTNPGTAAYGYSFEGSSQHLVYSDDEPCSNNILRIDADLPGSEVMVYDVEGIAAEPTVNPTDAGQILFMEQVCGEVGTLRLLDSDLTPQAIPGVVEQEGRFRQVSYSPDGSHFTYSAGSVVYIHDFTSETIAYTDDDATSSFGPSVFGHDARFLYAKWCSGDNHCDLVEIDPVAGTKTLIGVPDIRPGSETSPDIGWAPAALTLDSDGDGLGDGLDD